LGITPTFRAWSESERDLLRGKKSVRDQNTKKATGERNARRFQVGCTSNLDYEGRVTVKRGVPGIAPGKKTIYHTLKETFPPGWGYKN